jgi:hypothetical protein
MAIRRFKQFVKEQANQGRSCLMEYPVSKTLEFHNDEFEVVINITLSKQEQHGEAIQFLRRVADELSALERATRPSD